MIDIVDKFNTVDMGGIDIVESQGVAVEGLFNRILNAIQNCRYQILYNWKFAQIEIVPSPVELVFDGEKVSINEAITVTEDDVVHVYSLEPEPIVPVIEPLTITENGTYEASGDVDGYSPVEVSVPQIAIQGDVPPTSDIGENGQYYIMVAPAVFDALGITITVAARGTNYSFAYWGARDIDIVFLNQENEEVYLSEITNVHAYYASGSGSFTQQDAVINGNIGTYYEHNGLPGYWKFTGDFSGLKFKELKVYGRSDNWDDFWRTFSLNMWSSDKAPIGRALISEENLVLSDWNNGAYTVFQATVPIPLEPTVTYLYQKQNDEWVLIK